MYAIKTKLYTVEPVIYDHPLVPVILVVNDRWSQSIGSF